MSVFTTVYSMLRQRAGRRSRGQTMTEYALIMAAVAVVVFVIYQTMGTDIGTMVNGINTDLTTAS
jgi:Flp pilus assembly pilin Flp